MIFSFSLRFSLKLRFSFKVITISTNDDLICRYLRKILVVMALIKIKQTKKRWVFSLMSFNTTARIDVKCRISVFYCKHTNNQFFISGTSTSNIIYFSVFWLDLYFFSWPLMDPFLGARPPKIVHGFCFSTLVPLQFWMRSWRNAWRLQLGSRKWSVECITETFMLGLL